MEKSMVSTWMLLIAVITLAFAFSGCALLGAKTEEQFDKGLTQTKTFLCSQKPEIRDAVLAELVAKEVLHPNFCAGF